MRLPYFVRVALTLLLALGGLNVLLLLGLWRRSTTAPDAQSAQNAQDLPVAEQTAWQQQQFAAVLAQTERLDAPSELRRHRKLIAQIKTVQTERTKKAGVASSLT